MVGCKDMSNVTIEDVIDLLREFEPHGLNDLDKASLMNRVDTKFLVPVTKLPAIFKAIQPHYSVLEIDDKRCFKYQSTYFDTEDFMFYNMHHNGRLNRYKVRTRRYVDSDIEFLEVKFKNNKKRTIKKRVKLSNDGTIKIKDHNAFLDKSGIPQEITLKPCLKNSYKRIAFASEERGERLTIDLGLENQALAKDCNTKSKLKDVAIVELKQSRVDRESPFFSVVRSMGIRSSSFSKYCMGMMMTSEAVVSRENLRTNRFKRILRKVNRVAQKKQLEKETG